jgi:hypothetical protein
MQRVREQPALRVVEREAGFVAGAFEAENKHDVIRNGAELVRNCRLFAGKSSAAAKSKGKP